VWPIAPLASSTLLAPSALLVSSTPSALLASSTPSAPLASSAPYAPAAPLAPVQREPWADDAGPTARSPELAARLAAAAAPPPPELILPSPPVSAEEPRPPQRPAPETLPTTAPAVEIPAELRERMGRLPFKAPSPESALARTMKVPVHNLLQGQTTPIGDDSIEKVVSALPFPGKTAGTAIVPFPRLTPEQYASLCAELSVYPERLTDIRRRYHVMNTAAHRALDEHWRTQLDESPASRAKFHDDLARFTAWLRAKRAWQGSLCDPGQPSNQRAIPSK
jgi:hypothetical protein